MTKLSAAAALKCCGVYGSEAEEASDDIQSNLQDEWNHLDPCTLLAACDGREPGKLPAFYPNSASSSFDLTAKPDIMSTACPMVMEFKTCGADSELADGLQQVLKRLHVLLSVNCFITRSFGFAVNDGTSSFLVSIHRQLNSAVREESLHWYEDTVHILKIDTKYVAGIWNALTKRAQQDLCFILDPDVFALAATLKALSPPVAQSASAAQAASLPPPPPTSDWDLSRLIGFTKISLKGLSSSRVYGIYPIQEMRDKYHRKFIRATTTEPVFLVKINSHADRSCREHNALKQLAGSFTSDPSPWAKLFYVHQSFLFEGGAVSDTATFSTVAVADHFPTRASLQQLGVADSVKIAGLCVSRQCTSPEEWWWNRLRMSNQLPQRFATVVMKQAHRFTSVNPSARWEIAKCVNTWLDRIHRAGVLHTDIRPSNIMWLSVKSGEKYCENMKLTVPVVSAIGDALSATGSNRVGRNDNTVEREELMMPMVVDFDCAELTIDGKATVDISIEGARLTLIRAIRRVAPGQRSVEWTPSDDWNMASDSLFDL
eukprot:gene1708-1231_t